MWGAWEEVEWDAGGDLVFFEQFLRISRLCDGITREIDDFWRMDFEESVD